MKRLATLFLLSIATTLAIGQTLPNRPAPVQNRAAPKPKTTTTRTLAPALASPNALAPGTHAVDLSWTASTSACVTGYNVYRGGASGAEVIYTRGVVGTTYTDTGVSNGVTYWYTVTAVCPDGESAFSNEVSAAIPTPPVAPVLNPLQVLATGPGTHSVSVPWAASTSTGVTAYNVYRGTTAGTETLYASGVVGTTYTDTAVVNGQTYFYEVTAVSPGGESVVSNERNVLVPMPPAPPTNLRATAQ